MSSSMGKTSPRSRTTETGAHVLQRALGRQKIAIVARWATATLGRRGGGDTSGTLPAASSGKASDNVFGQVGDGDSIRAATGYGLRARR